MIRITTLMITLLNYIIALPYQKRKFMAVDIYSFHGTVKCKTFSIMNFNKFLETQQDYPSILELGTSSKYFQLCCHVLPRRKRLLS